MERQLLSPLFLPTRGCCTHRWSHTFTTGIVGCNCSGNTCEWARDGPPATREQDGARQVRHETRRAVPAIMTRSSRAIIGSPGIRCRAPWHNRTACRRAPLEEVPEEVRADDLLARCAPSAPLRSLAAAFLWLRILLGLIIVWRVL
jgi:hypothetical protein